MAVLPGREWGDIRHIREVIGDAPGDDDDTTTLLHHLCQRDTALVEQTY